MHGGRTLAYVYDAGDPEVDRVAREAVAAYAASNALDPTAFPSLLQMENELVGFACDLLDAPGTAVGHGDVRRHRVDPAGGAGSARRPARRRTAADGAARRRRTRPSTRRRTTSASRRCSCRSVPTSAPTPPRWPRRSTTTPCWSSPARRRTPTGWWTRSPRSRQPLPRAGSAATSTRASAAGCSPTPPAWAATSRRGPSRSRASPRSRSTRTSTPTRRRARRCCCTATPALRRPQFFASAAWPGYTMLNATTQSTRSGGPIAGTWAVVEHIGDDGYLALAEQALAAVDAIVACIAARARAAARRGTRLHAGHARHRRLVRPVHADRRAAGARAGTSSRSCRSATTVRASTCR